MFTRVEEDAGVGDEIAAGFHDERGLDIAEGVPSRVGDGFEVERRVVRMVRDAEPAADVHEFEVEVDRSGQFTHARDEFAVIPEVVARDATAGVGVDSHDVEGVRGRFEQ